MTSPALMQVRKWLHDGQLHQATAGGQIFASCMQQEVEKENGRRIHVDAEKIIETHNMASCLAIPYQPSGYGPPRF